MISIILLILAGIFNACMDVLRFKFSISIFSNWKNQQWINPVISSQNKWKYVDGIRVGEKFFGSSTFLVFVTDFWHFCKFLMLINIMSAIVFYYPIINWWIDLLIMYCSFTIPFEIFYSQIFINDK
jgi:hypothetical protein